MGLSGGNQVLGTPCERVQGRADMLAYTRVLTRRQEPSPEAMGTRCCERDWCPEGAWDSGKS